LAPRKLGVWHNPILCKFEGRDRAFAGRDYTELVGDDRNSFTLRQARHIASIIKANRIPAPIGHWIKALDVLGESAFARVFCKAFRYRWHGNRRSTKRAEESSTMHGQFSDGLGFSGQLAWDDGKKRGPI
jgi:hypothetical protein